MTRRGANRRGRIAAAVLGAVLACPLAACAHQGTAASAGSTRAASTSRPAVKATAPAVKATRPAVTTTASQVPIGVYSPGESGSWDTVAQFSRQAGQPVRYVVSYLGPQDPFPAQLAEQAAAHGAELIVQLEPTMSATKVVAGDDDGYLSSLAAQIASFGRPVIVSWAAEANGNWYGYGYTRTPVVQYRATWAHVLSVFSGVPNITWMETLNRTYEGAGPISEYYVPGVDMYGVDAYYSFANDTFETVAGETVRQIRALTGKPILIAETGIGQDNSQVASLPGLVAGVRANHLAGFVYFNEDQGVGSPYHQNWALTGDAFSVLRASLASAAARG